MFYFLLIVHCTLCAFLIGLVLIQQGKGADMGATFGGSNSNTVFGAGGAADLITKATTSLAIAFMVTSILLVRQYASGGATAAVKTVDPLAGSLMEQLEVAAPDVGAETADSVAEPAEPAAAAKTVEKSANSDSKEGVVEESETSSQTQAVEEQGSAAQAAETKSDKQ